MTIIIKRADGGVSIMTLTDEATDVNSEIAKWSASHPGQFVSFRECKASDIQSDLTFREAWCDETDTPGIDIDLTKAHTIALANLRLTRAPLFLPLDILAARAQEANDTVTYQSIIKKKQILRDCTNTLKAIVTKGYNDLSVLGTIQKAMSLPGVSNG